MGQAIFVLVIMLFGGATVLSQDGAWIGGPGIGFFDGNTEARGQTSEVGLPRMFFSGLAPTKSGRSEASEWFSGIEKRKHQKTNGNETEKRKRECVFCLLFRL
ncbi:MAG: hypothetical protein WEB37_00305 [Bacteroidota bacterium]